MTLTLSPNAAEDVGGVINAIADLLKIAVPPSYEISRSPSPEQPHRAPPTKRNKLYSSGARPSPVSFSCWLLHCRCQKVALRGQCSWHSKRLGKNVFQ